MSAPALSSAPRPARARRPATAPRALATVYAFDAHPQGRRARPHGWAELFDRLQRWLRRPEPRSARPRDDHDAGRETAPVRTPLDPRDIYLA